MKCNKCGANLNPRDQFCLSCGELVENSNATSDAEVVNIEPQIEENLTNEITEVQNDVIQEIIPEQVIEPTSEQVPEVVLEITEANNEAPVEVETQEIITSPEVVSEIQEVTPVSDNLLNEENTAENVETITPEAVNEIQETTPMSDNMLNEGNTAENVEIITPEVETVNVGEEMVSIEAVSESPVEAPLESNFTEVQSEEPTVQTDSQTELAPTEIDDMNQTVLTDQNQEMSTPVESDTILQNEFDASGFIQESDDAPVSDIAQDEQSVINDTQESEFGGVSLGNMNDVAFTPAPETPIVEEPKAAEIPLDLPPIEEAIAPAENMMINDNSVENDVIPTTDLPPVKAKGNSVIVIVLIIVIILGAVVAYLYLFNDKEPINNNNTDNTSSSSDNPSSDEVDESSIKSLGITFPSEYIITETDDLITAKTEEATISISFIEESASSIKSSASKLSTRLTNLGYTGGTLRSQAYSGKVFYLIDAEQNGKNYSFAYVDASNDRMLEIKISREDNTINPSDFSVVASSVVAALSKSE